MLNLNTTLLFESKHNINMNIMEGKDVSKKWKYQYYLFVITEPLLFRIGFQQSL